MTNNSIRIKRKIFFSPHVCNEKNSMWTHRKKADYCQPEPESSQESVWSGCLSWILVSVTVRKLVCLAWNTHLMVFCIWQSSFYPITSCYRSWELTVCMVQHVANLSELRAALLQLWILHTDQQQAGMSPAWFHSENGLSLYNVRSDYKILEKLISWFGGFGDFLLEDVYLYF